VLQQTARLTDRLVGHQACLEDSTACDIAVAAADPFLQAAAVEVRAEKKIKVAINGFGRIGR
jgi:plastocyanin domain-containing protein